jgi:hypothetical protein
MAKLTMCELDIIRERAMFHQVVANKLWHYSEICSDSQLQQTFKSGAQSAESTCSDLISMIGNP